MNSAESSPAPARLVADIGGTHARFALVAADGAIGTPTTLVCDDYAGPGEAVRAFLHQVGEPRVREAVMAVATPVRGDRVTWTNRRDWSFSIAELKDALGLDRLEIINDFAALALSLPRLDADALAQIGRGRRVFDAPHAAIGPGTGLGVSGLVAGRQEWCVIDGEGGHVAISPVTARERAVVATLAGRFGRVSAERVLTGPGLVNLYQALAVLDDQSAVFDQPDAITHAALDASDDRCVETLNVFCELLATTAANLALTLGAHGGVYIGGGIVPQLGGFFENSGFRERFESAGRMSNFLMTMPTYVIRARYPALTGAAAAFARSR